MEVCNPIQFFIYMPVIITNYLPVTNSHIQNLWKVAWSVITQPLDLIAYAALIAISLSPTEIRDPPSSQQHQL